MGCQHTIEIQSQRQHTRSSQLLWLLIKQPSGSRRFPDQSAQLTTMLPTGSYPFNNMAYDTIP